MSTRDLIEAPPARPPVYGIIAAGEVVDDPAVRLAAGTKWAPESCGNGGGRTTAELCGGGALDELPANPGIVESDPFLVWGGDTCSTFGFAARDWNGRARRALEAVESYQLAEELWTGSLGLAQRSLADGAADTMTTSGTDVADGIACLEAGLGELGKGRRGILHLTTKVLALAVAAQVLQRQGNIWTTPMGHLVIADAGYPGTGPNGEPADGTQWGYATSWLRIRRGPVDVVPGDVSDARRMAEALDRGVNTVVVYAERLVTWEWDECVHVAAEFDVPVCAIAGAS